MRLVDCFVKPLAYTAYIVGTAGVEQPDYSQISALLQKFIADGEKLSENAGYLPAEYDEARFAVCAWIDEAILCSSLPARDNWMTDLLQRHFYNTTRAGEEFYQHLQGLTEEMEQVKTVYYHCLALGFRGRYFAPESEGELKSIKHKLLTSLKGNSSMLSTANDLMGFFPDSYPANPVNRRRRLPKITISSFTLLLVLLPLFFLFFTYLSYSRSLDVIASALLRMEFR